MKDELRNIHTALRSMSNAIEALPRTSSVEELSGVVKVAIKAAAEAYGDVVLSEARESL